MNFNFLKFKKVRPFKTENIKYPAVLTVTNTKTGKIEKKTVHNKKEMDKITSDPHKMIEYNQ